MSSTPIPQRRYNHMESILGSVKQIDPKTGEEIPPQPLDPKIVVRHYMRTTRRWPQNLEHYFLKGFKNLTPTDIQKVYRAIKGFSCKKQLQLSS